MEKTDKVNCPFCGHKEEIPEGAASLFAQLTVEAKIKEDGCQSCRLKKTLAKLRIAGNASTAIIILAFIAASPDNAPGADGWKEEARKIDLGANPWAHHLLEKLLAP